VSSPKWGKRSGVAGIVHFIGARLGADIEKVRQASIACGINGIGGFQNEFMFSFSWFKSSA
jgi:hypothetical protein